MTGKERFMKTMRFEEPDRPPHFESMFELEREAFGLQFPDRNSWGGCAAAEKERKIGQCMEIYQKIVDRFKWDALCVYWPWGDPDGVAAAKKTFGDDIAIGGMIGGALIAIENVDDWMAFAVKLADERSALIAEAEARCRASTGLIDKMADAGADFVFIPCDVAFNAGPFVSPADFAEICAPYLARVVQRAKDRGLIAIYHSDGDLNPILDQLLACGPHCLMSIDPMAGMDIAAVKRKTYGRMALMGNVQCNLMQEGPREAIEQSARYCLTHGAPGGGYVFSTSNTIFSGMPLENYEHMLATFKNFTNRQGGPSAPQLGSQA